MTLTRVATLPVAGVNLGLGSAVIGLQAEVTKLTAEIAALSPAFAAQVALGVTPIDPLTLPAAVAAHIAGGLAASLAPTIYATASATTAVSLGVQLGLVEVAIAAARKVTVSLSAGFSAGGIAGWSYSGRPQGFAKVLSDQLPAGFGDVRGADAVGAIIIATESFESWGQFSVGFETGASSGANLGQATTKQNLTFLGAKTGGSWNTGVAKFKARIDLLLAELEGLKVALEASLALALGLSLDGVDVDAALEVAANIDLGSVDISASVDIDASIGDIELQIAAVLDLVAEINGQLSAGGLTLWTYSGPLDQIGRELEPELRNGMPGGSGPNAPIYGLTLACSSPSAWADFGLIMLNAA